MSVKTDRWTPRFLLGTEKPPLPVDGDVSDNLFRVTDSVGHELEQTFEITVIDEAVKVTGVSLDVDSFSLTVSSEVFHVTC